jgi:Bacterial SH3 domain
MLPLPKILTLPGVLTLLFPPAAPGKATDWPEAWLIKLFYGVAAWSMLGAPNWLRAKVELPKVDLPQVEQASNFTTAQTATALKPTALKPTALKSTANPTATGVLVRCPSNLQVVNIRQTAGLSAVVAQVNCGDRVNILGNDRPNLNGETWVPVEFKGSKGWATARYLAL